MRAHGENALADLVDHIRRGVSGIFALEKVTGMQLIDIENAWHHSIQKINFGGDYVYQSYSMKDLLEREKWLKEGVSRHPDYGLLRSRLADTLFALNSYRASIVEAKAALDDPHFHFPVFAWGTMGNVYLKTNQVANAKHAYEQVLSYQPWYETIRESDFIYLIRILKYYKNHQSAKVLEDTLARLKAADELY